MEVWIAYDWPFWPLELASYETINGRAINSIWSSSHMTNLWTVCSSPICTSLWTEGSPTVWQTHNFSTRQLPSYSFIIFLGDGRNNDGLHSIWQGFFDAIHIALNAFHVTHLVMATCRSLTSWTCEYKVSISRFDFTFFPKTFHFPCISFYLLQASEFASLICISTISFLTYTLFIHGWSYWC